MRQNSKNNRSRGRGGRKGPNPLTRSYESNGPDVKVRGTAQHVAEKYMSLARDALSSGDTVSAENYFQHAEHYNRIIMSAQAQANAAREEERRNSQQAAENSEQPRIESTGDPATSPQPTTDDGSSVSVNGTPADGDSKSAVNGNGSHPEGEEIAAAPRNEEPRKPRTRRSPSRGPRSRPPKDKTADAMPDVEKSEQSDTIADNPPAFLMSE